MSKPPIKKKRFQDPEEIWDLFLQYVNDVNFRTMNDTVHNPKTLEQGDIKKVAPVTWYGFDMWLGFNQKIWSLEDYKYNRNGDYEAYSAIISRIDKFIYNHKISGASLNIYNHNIIARELGLADKREVDKTSNKVSKIEIIKSNNKSEE